MKNFNLNNLNSPDYEFLFGEKRMVFKDAVAPKPDANLKAKLDAKNESKKTPSQPEATEAIEKRAGIALDKVKTQIKASEKREQLKEAIKAKTEAEAKLKKDFDKLSTDKDAKTIKFAEQVAGDAKRLGNKDIVAKATDILNDLIKNKILTPEELNKASKHEKKENLKGLNFAAIAIRLRENPSVNPDRWTAFSAAELETVKKEWRILGIYKENPFYRNIFRELSKCYDPSFFNKDEAKEKLQNYKFAFQHPEQTKYDLDPAFQSALSFFNYVKVEILRIGQGGANTVESIQKKDDDPIFTRAKHVVQDNINKFREAIQNKDYTTAGIYVLGCYAAFKLWKGMDEKNKGDYKKYFFWAAALYTGHIFAKNAGYNIAKKLGLESIDSELKGTPLAALYKLDVLDKKVEIDNDLFKGISIVRVGSLYDQYNESNSKGWQFIDPNNFPWAVGKKFDGLHYADLMSTEQPLNRNQQKYKQAGHQLYILTKALEDAYMKTIALDSPGVSFAQALKKPALKDMTVLDLMNTFSRYALNRGEKSLFSDNISKEMYSRIDEISKGRDIGFGAPALNKRGDYEVTAMGGFPVVLRRSADDKAIYVFAKKDYENDEKLSHTGSALATIPLTGNADIAMNDLRKGITDKMRELMQPLEFGNGTKIEAPKFDSSKWTAKVTLAASPKYDLKEEVVDATIEPREDGKGVFVTLARGGRINVNESLSKQAPVGFRMIQRVLDTAEFKALRAFNMVDRIKFVEKGPSASGFSLLIGANNLEIKFNYNKKTKKIELVDPKQVKDLIKDPSFAKEYVAALQSDRQYSFNKTVAKLSEAIKYAPENFWSHMWQSVRGKVGSNPSKGLLDAFSGNVPNYFSQTVLDVAKYSAYERLRRTIPSAKDLNDVKTLESRSLYDANAKLEGVYEIIKKEGKNIESWDRDKFMTEVVHPIRESGGKSASYALKMYDLEFKAYDLFSGVMENSDLKRTSHDKVSSLLKVFAYHTAYLDGSEFTYKNYGDEENFELETTTIDLDSYSHATPKLTGPVYDQLKKDGKITDKDDPGYRAYYIMNYMDYVKSEIISQTGQKKDKPFFSVADFDILSFESWMEQKGNWMPKDPIGTMPQYEHDPNDPNQTELEDTIKNTFDRAITFLELKYPDINWEEVRNYLYKTEQEAGNNVEDIGLFEGDSNGKTTLRDWANNISKLKSRAQQVQAIQNKVKMYLFDAILKPENKDRFFYPEMSGIAKLGKKFPFLKDVGWLRKYMNK